MKKILQILTAIMAFGLVVAYAHHLQQTLWMRKFTHS